MGVWGCGEGGGGLVVYSCTHMHHSDSPSLYQTLVYVLNEGALDKRRGGGGPIVACRI